MPFVFEDEEQDVQRPKASSRFIFEDEIDTEAADYFKAPLAGALKATGYGVRGVGQFTHDLGEKLRTTVNDTFGTDFEPEEDMLRGAGDYLTGLGNKVEQSYSPGAKAAIAGFNPTGNVFKPEGEFSFGDNVTPQGVGLHMLDTFGQIAPIAATALVTRGGGMTAQMGKSAGVAAAMGGGAAAAEEGNRIRQMMNDPEKLSSVPAYRALREEGVDHESAVEDVARIAESGAFWHTAPVSALTGVLVGGVLSNAGQRALSKIVGTGTTARILGGAAISAPLEGAQEVAELSAQQYGASQATGEPREIGEGSFGEGLMGAMGGAGTAALGGALPVRGGLKKNEPMDLLQPETPFPDLPGEEPGASQAPDSRFVFEDEQQDIEPDIPAERPINPAMGDAFRKAQEVVVPQENQDFLQDVQPEYAGPDRRTDTAKRKKISEMSQDEMRAALLTSDVTGLPSRRAYEDAPKRPVQVSVDADALKWINDNMGPSAGDDLLRSIGKAMQDETPDSFHFSGDEFLAQADTEEEASALMQKVNERLKKAVIIVQKPDGTKYIKQGLEVTHGTGPDKESADYNLKRIKQEREDVGLRPKRGNQPPGVVIELPQGKQDTQRAVAAEEIATHEMLDGSVMPGESHPGGQILTPEKQAAPQVSGVDPVIADALGKYNQSKDKFHGYLRGRLGKTKFAQRAKEIEQAWAESKQADLPRAETVTPPPEMARAAIAVRSGPQVLPKSPSPLKQREEKRIAATGAPITFEELGRLSDEAQKRIDARYEELNAKGVSWEAQKEDVALNDLYKKRFVYDDQAAQKGFDGAKEIVERNLAGLVNPRDLSNVVNYSLGAIYALHKKQTTGVYMMAEYTGKAIDSPATIEKLARDISKALLAKEYPIADYELAMTSRMSGLSSSVKVDLLKRSRTIAENINSDLREFFLDTPGSINQPVSASIANESVKPVEQKGKAQEPDDQPSKFILRGDYWNYSGDRVAEISKVLGLTIASRDGKPMLGIPKHARADMERQLSEAGINAEFVEASQSVSKSKQTDIENVTKAPPPAAPQERATQESPKNEKALQADERRDAVQEKEEVNPQTDAITKMAESVTRLTEAVEKLSAPKEKVATEEKPAKAEFELQQLGATSGEWSTVQKYNTQSEADAALPKGDGWRIKKNGDANRDELPKAKRSADDGAKFSKSAQPSTSLTPAEATTQLSRLIGSRSAQALIESGRVVLVEDGAGMPGDADKFSVHKFLQKNAVGVVALVNDKYQENGNYKGSGDVFLLPDGRILIDGVTASVGDILTAIKDADSLDGVRYVRPNDANLTDEILMSEDSYIRNVIKQSESINRKVAKKSPSKPTDPEDIFGVNDGRDEWKDSRWPDARKNWTSDYRSYEWIESLSEQHSPELIKKAIIEKEIAKRSFVIGGYLHLGKSEKISQKFVDAILSYKEAGGKIGKSAIDAIDIFNKQDSSDYKRSADKEQTLGATTKDGKMYLNLAALDKNSFDGVALHEGLHSTLKSTIGEADYARLMRRMENLQKLAQNGTGTVGKFFKKGMAAIPADTKPEHQTEELAAYGLQMYISEPRSLPDTIRKWIADFLAAIRVGLMRSLPKNSKLRAKLLDSATEADLARLAIVGLRRAAKGAEASVGDGVMASKTSDHFPDAGKMVDGRRVLSSIPNQGSIAASLDDYEILDNVREVPFSAFTQMPELKYYSTQEGERTKRLSKEIEYSREIAPLIVVVDSEGPYILEGGHRFDALRELGAKSFPALVVLDNAQTQPNQDIRYSKSKTEEKQVRAEFAKQMDDAKVSWWDKSLGTQYHIAMKKGNESFRKVFEIGQDFIGDVSKISIKSETLAPNLFRQMTSIKQAFKTGRASQEDIKAIATPIYTGTIVDERVYSAKELRERFKMTTTQISLYEEAMKATHNSLDSLTTSTLHKMAGTLDVPKSVLDPAREEANTPKEFMERIYADHLKSVRDDAKKQADEADADLKLAEKDFAPDSEAVAEAKDNAESAKKALKRINDGIAMLYSTMSKAEKLKKEGYFPLMRWGDFSVDVTTTDAAGKETREYFGMYETRAQAIEAAAAFRQEFPTAAVKVGTVNKESWRLFPGLTTDTLEAFAKQTGMEQDSLFQEYLRSAVANRSAMKRFIHRKNIPGHSRDVNRTLATFIVSNARLASAHYHMSGMTDAVLAIPKNKGELATLATNLKLYLTNPTEEFAGLRNFFFFNFIGGSVASALTNLTQVPMMTLPYLTQFDTNAWNTIRQWANPKRKPVSPDHRAAIKRAEDEGIVSPQEIHNLMATARGGQLGAGKVLSDRRVQTALYIWGSMFGAAEQFNRRVTFNAAYAIALKNKEASPYGFAKKAVEETQGIYNRGNRPRWARGIGAPILTFKQFSISYIEFLGRLPPKQKALAISLLILAAGLQGLPGEEDAEDLLDTIMQWAGYQWKTRVEMEDFAHRVLGENMGGLLTRGISSTGIPLDVQARMGFGNLIPGTSVLKPSETNRSREVSQVFGVTSGVLEGVGKALEAMAKGEYGKAALAVAPKAVRDVAKGLDMADTGEYKDSSGKKVADVSGQDAALKGIGFQPTSVTGKTRKIYSLDEYIQHHKVVESGIVDKWARGIAQQKPELIKEAKRERDNWNEKNPTMKIAISGQQLMSKVKQYRLTSDQRLKNRSPKELRGYISEQLN